MATLPVAPPDTSAAESRAAVGADPAPADWSQGALATPSFSPLYQQIRTLILRRLQAGEWRPGEMIPSEQDLAARFRVSPGTVRKAVDELAADNLLLRRQGKGTFVTTHAEAHIQYRFLRLLPDAGSLEAQGPAERRIIECRRLRASAEVARQLALRSGAPILQVRRVLSFRGSPAILEDLWLPGEPFKGLTLQALSSDTGPMYALFETRFGVRMVRALEKIKAVAADADAAHWLHVPMGQPLLSVERLAYTYSDVPMELRRGLYRTDARHYRTELS